MTTAFNIDPAKFNAALNSRATAPAKSVPLAEAHATKLHKINNAAEAIHGRVAEILVRLRGDDATIKPGVEKPLSAPVGALLVAQFEAEGIHRTIESLSGLLDELETLV